MDLQQIKRIGIAAAYEGAKVLKSHLGHLSQVNRKGAIDLVTEADLRSEKVIIETIRAAFPDHAILAEETGSEAGAASDYLWVIDPLDGTTNYAHELGLFAVSIAFACRGDILFGIVLNPVSEELFMGIKEHGAFLNGRPVQVSKKEKVADCLLVTGFPYDLHTILEPLMTRFRNCLSASLGVRRLGSAALDLCYVACGRFDAFWEQNLKPWDTAAGKLIAEEAGACVSDFMGKPFSPFAVEKKEILASNGRIHDEMLSLMDLKEGK